ncbi:hypothetical protein CIG11343_0832 [Campylobacter iguaniorum]|uniref:NlpC/P60 family protein n=1 Tax=Campylobacter iguaniorum TaxID=1244531 RepID=UPI0007C88CBF|nr:NlpC/P60 family protein [Campylobacter iguaniorum]ANE35865.1 hypothetical protein CIG11343_0832 [Campylobacter iguaniorum]
MNIKTICIGAIGVLFLSACSTKSDIFTTQINSYKFNSNQDYGSSLTRQFKQNDDKESNVSYEKDINLSKYLNKKVGRDCSGLVTLINNENNELYFNSKELDNFYDKHGRKSQALFNMYKAENKIAFDEPKLGDLVFFNNTTKGTRKLKENRITHVGIVDKIEPNGTVTFLHNINGKNIRSVMNLKYKNTHKLNGKKINAYITRCNNTSCLVSNKFAGFGKIDKNLNIKY